MYFCWRVLVAVQYQYMKGLHLALLASRSKVSHTVQPTGVCLWHTHQQKCGRSIHCWKLQALLRAGCVRHLSGKEGRRMAPLPANCASQATPHVYSGRGRGLESPVYTNEPPIQTSSSSSERPGCSALNSSN